MTPYTPGVMDASGVDAAHPAHLHIPHLLPWRSYLKPETETETETETDQ